MALVLNNITIESRESDLFVNATQLCKAGGKQFNNWFKLDSTKALIGELENRLNPHIRGLPISAVETKRGRYHSGSWIHPDLAVPLAMWISPAFTIQVSRWIQELVLTGAVSLDTQKTDDELRQLQRQVMEQQSQLQEQKAEIEQHVLSNAKLAKRERALNSFIENNRPLEKHSVFYIATCPSLAANNRFKYGGVGALKALKGRLAQYNSSHPEDDLFYYAKVVRCNDYTVLEKRVGSILQQFKDKAGGSKEMLHLRYDLLEAVVDFVAEHYDREIDYVVEHCRQFLEATIAGEPVVPPPVEPEGTMEIVVSRGGHRRTQKIDISSWTDDQVNAKIEEIVNTCAREHQPTYEFATQKDTVPVELRWSALSAHMKPYDSKMNAWRERFKSWFVANNPAKFKVRGIKVL